MCNRKKAIAAAPHGLGSRGEYEALFDPSDLGEGGRRDPGVLRLWGWEIWGHAEQKRKAYDCCAQF